MFEFRLHTFIIFFVPSRGLEELNVRLFCNFYIGSRFFFVIYGTREKKFRKSLCRSQPATGMPRIRDLDCASPNYT